MIPGVDVDAIVLFYSFRFATKDMVLVDKVCLAISVIGAIVYVLLSSKPLLSPAVATIAELISFFPTIRKTRNDPYSESLPSYYLPTLKSSLILIALRKYNLLTTSYSVLWPAVFVLFPAGMFGPLHLR